jgi:hypothetical protein
MPKAQGLKITLDAIDSDYSAFSAFPRIAEAGAIAMN